MWSGKTVGILSVVTILGLGVVVIRSPQGVEMTQEEVFKKQAQESIDKAEHEAERRSKMTRYELEMEEKRRGQREKVFFFGGIAALFVVTYFFPRFGMLVLGPGVLMATAWFLFSDKELAGFLFSSKGDSWAGLFRLIVWGIVLLAFALGAGIIAFGRARIRQQEQAGADDISSEIT